MRNIVLGVLAVIWGVAVVVTGPPVMHAGAYGAGEIVGYLLGFALLGAGVVAVRNGVRARRRDRS